MWSLVIEPWPGKPVPSRTEELVRVYVVLAYTTGSYGATIVHWGGMQAHVVVRLAGVSNSRMFVSCHSAPSATW
ncbi:hypothetical protein JAAARDRAFT_462773 [Jaapia argillacea MUCL 33604]|uniref:Uncharacterized protein n=1 Tax=Jaapia argillacea MUCL 33604 TaxID=933084 RepID=A0A067Q8N3_9AGAM|nr:hypothetical protein JAAARDRAFT_462773 [Jaapia argillacea MUCL 33604]